MIRENDMESCLWMYVEDGSGEGGSAGGWIGRGKEGRKEWGCKGKGKWRKGG